MRKLAAGNWKMNGTGDSLSQVEALIGAHPAPNCDVLLCPPATLIGAMAQMTQDSPLMTGAQDCHPAASGAHTGDLSAQQLVAAGAKMILTGHSERRTDHNETNATVLAKTEAAQSAGAVAIVCIGETLAERESGATLDVIAAQLAQSLPDDCTGDTTIVAYEPVWAIGTGRVPDMEQIGEVHSFIRRKLTQRFGAACADTIRLLYGGSVKGSNATEIFAVPNVDGALVGGASLTAEDFGPIISALDAS